MAAADCGIISAGFVISATGNGGIQARSQVVLAAADGYIRCSLCYFASSRPAGQISGAATYRSVIIGYPIYSTFISTARNGRPKQANPGKRDLVAHETADDIRTT